MPIFDLAIARSDRSRALADDASRSCVSSWELRLLEAACNGAGLIPASGGPASIGWPSECVRRPTGFVLAHAGI
jgi:hypothetical protein